MLLHEHLGALLAGAKADAGFHFASRQAALVAVEQERVALVAHGDGIRPPVAHAVSLSTERDRAAGSVRAPVGAKNERARRLSHSSRSRALTLARLGMAGRSVPGAGGQARVREDVDHHLGVHDACLRAAG